MTTVGNSSTSFAFYLITLETGFLCVCVKIAQFWTGETWRGKSVGNVSPEAETAWPIIFFGERKIKKKENEVSESSKKGGGLFSSSSFSKINDNFPPVLYTYTSGQRHKLFTSFFPLLFAAMKEVCYCMSGLSPLDQHVAVVVGRNLISRSIINS